MSKSPTWATHGKRTMAQIRYAGRRLVYVGHLQLMMGATNKANALAAEIAELKRQLAEREQQLATVQRDRDAMFSAFHDFRDAVDRRRAAEESLVEFYRQAYDAQQAARVAPDEVPARRRCPVFFRRRHQPSRPTAREEASVRIATRAALQKILYPRSLGRSG